MARNEIKVSSVTLNWNGRDVLLRCIDSLLKQTFELFEIIVVDNGSEDDSVAMVKEKFPEVVVVQNEANFGAPKGRNAGLRRAMEKQVDYIFTLDNDLFADSQCVAEMVKYAEANPEIGMMGAFIYDAARTDHLLSAGNIVSFTQNVTGPFIVHPPYDTLYDVDFVGTGHLLTRRSVFESIGYLDETFIGYGFEDTDFGMRAAGEGFRISVCPSAKVWHTPHSNVGVYSFRKKYLESRNAVIFMRRYGTFWGWIKFLFYAIFGLPYAFVVQGLMKKHLPGVWGKARGLVDGFLGRKALAESLLESSVEKKK